MIKEFKLKIDWLFWFIVLLPTFYVFGTESLREPQAAFFKLAIVAMVAIFHINKWISALLVFAFIQSIVFKTKESISAMTFLFYGALLYHFIVHYAKDTKKYFNAFLIVFLFNSFWCFLQFLGVDPLFTITEYKNQQRITDFSGFFTLPAFWGNFVAVAAPIVMCIHPAFLLLSAVGIFFSKSTFSAVAFCVAVLFVLWFRKRILFWVLGAALLTAGTFYIVKFDMPSGQFNKRLVVWNLTFKDAVQNQFFGKGIGSFGAKKTLVELEPSGNTAFVSNDAELLLFIMTEPVLKQNSDVVDYVKSLDLNNWDKKALQDKITQIQPIASNFKIWHHPHSEFMKIFYEMGVVGLFIVIGYFVSLFKRFLGSYKNPRLVCLTASMLAIIIVCLGHFPFYLARLAGPFVVILALLEYELLREENA